MTQYLYGAAVQGIQGFIFQTNRLREIVGASELVEQICTSLFRDMVGADFSDNNLIIGAAGNIKYIFDSREECERVVEGFPKMVMELAPGITVSQAVVALESDLRSSDIQELERRLKIQRNRPMPQLNLASMSMERSRRTGGAGVEYRKGEVIDLPTLKKLDESDSSTMRLLGKILTQQGVDYARDLNELVDQGEDNSYIAVIHADGNGLGAILQQLGDSVTKRYPTKVKEAFKSFSLALDRATVEAAKSAFELTYVGVDRDRVKLRPVILGGDDLTVICDAKHALAFTHHFLSEFERHTRMEFERSLSEFNLKQTHLTACAGVAFVKSSYPFHYAIKLAEALCAESKVESKSRAARAGIDLAASSYLFHKVQASYIEDYGVIKQRELVASGVKLTRGPLFIDESPRSGDFLRRVNILNRAGAPVSQMRRWLTELHESQDQADQLMRRSVAILEQKNRGEFVKEFNLKSPIVDGMSDIYQLLSAHSLGVLPLEK